MSEIYIGDGYWRESEEPAARYVAANAAADYRQKQRERQESNAEILALIERDAQRMRSWSLFLIGFAVGAWAAALLGGSL